MQHFIENKDFPDELKKTVKNIDLALSELEQLVDKFTSTPLLDAQTLLKPLSKSEYDTAAVYSATSVYWAYLKMKGVDPKAIGLLKELERVKNVINRQKLVSEKEKAPKIDVTVAQRFIRSGLYEPKQDEKMNDTSSKIVPPASKKARLE